MQHFSTFLIRKWPKVRLQVRFLSKMMVTVVTVIVYQIQLRNMEEEEIQMDE
jgi:hypothetical protein